MGDNILLDVCVSVHREERIGCQKGFKSVRDVRYILLRMIFNLQKQAV